MKADRTHASKQDTYRQMGTLVAYNTYIGRQHTCRTGIRGRSAMHINKQNTIVCKQDIQGGGTCAQAGHSIRQDIILQDKCVVRTHTMRKHRGRMLRHPNR
jgi:hypothetical protein